MFITDAIASLTISLVMVGRELEAPVPLLVDGTAAAVDEKPDVEAPLLVDGPASMCAEEPGEIPALAKADDNNDDVTGCRDDDAPLEAPDDLNAWIRSSFAATSSA